jgi:hypothetical protein
MDKLIQCCRNSVKDQSKKYALSSIVNYETVFDTEAWQNNLNQQKFLNFRLSESQGDILINKLSTHDLFIDAEALSLTLVNGWATQNYNNIIWDIREVPNWEEYIIEIETPVEIPEE